MLSTNNNDYDLSGREKKVAITYRIDINKPIRLHQIAEARKTVH
jgi:hypothetical protein